MVVGFCTFEPIISGDRMLGPQNTPGQRAHVIGLALCSYANDNNGAYPKGGSSTEVFQKLIDGGYVSDPRIFFDSSYSAYGKKPATSNKLEPENVCWDVTSPINIASSNVVPVVFYTGFRVNYVAGGDAESLFLASDQPSAGIMAGYCLGDIAWHTAQPNGVVKNFISLQFKPDGKKYMQLTPDGPLAP
jgi:hypothetical protein